MKYGDLSPSRYRWFVFSPYKIDTAYVGYDFQKYPFVIGDWYNLCVTLENGTLRLYVNGTLFSQVDNCTFNSVSTNLRLFGTAWGTDVLANGWLSSLRIYEYVLEADEIKALAKEFTPTT